jgi:hypothetical protein
LIFTSYEIITPESVEVGDYAETGWEDEEGQSMEPDKFDLEEGKTPVDLAVEFLVNNGPQEASCSHFCIDVWYSGSPEQNFSNGEETTYSYHLVGFSEEEQQQIFDRVTK